MNELLATLKEQARRFLFCVQFFSRISLPSPLQDWVGHDGSLAKSGIHFPLAGLAIGLIPAVFFAALASFLPASIAGGIAIMVGILVTGGLHEDGFADCADGLGGGLRKERALEIMKDSRIGTYGGIALIFSVGLRWAALSAMAPMAGFLALLICHSGARAAMVPAFTFYDYARTEGLGKSVAEGMELPAFLLTMGVAIACGLLLGQAAGVMAILFGLIAATLFLFYLNHRLGGYTGDGLGAMEQWAEITILITLVTLWT